MVVSRRITGNESGWRGCCVFVIEFSGCDVERVEYDVDICKVVLFV